MSQRHGGGSLFGNKGYGCICGGAERCQSAPARHLAASHNIGPCRFFFIQTFNLNLSAVNAPHQGAFDICRPLLQSSRFFLS
ncbi:hypothetical protein EZZ80_10125 [Pseudomonas putida]|nr:hypothetical protein DM483_21790 [Pseudomonas sp. SMT-1]QDW57609.1 hypothetical protein FFH79_012345 [Pseudomonas sp. KBS0802]UZA73831.1 hypothetical protein EZZ80_10125 [Pseudomonas putida]